MKKLISIILIPALLGCSTNSRPWTESEKRAAWFYLAAHTANAFSTENFLDDRRNHEFNPILGKHPNDTEIITYFSLTGVATILIAHFKPEWRERLLYTYGGINLGMTIHDYSK